MTEMPDHFAPEDCVECDSCGAPTIPNLSQWDEDGCIWSCINPECPQAQNDEMAEVESEDLEAVGLPMPWSGFVVSCLELLHEYIHEDPMNQD